MLTQRLLTLGGLESPVFPGALSHARVYCALAGVCLPLVMNLPKVPLVLCPWAAIPFSLPFLSLCFLRRQMFSMLDILPSHQLPTQAK